MFSGDEAFPITAALDRERLAGVSPFPLSEEADRRRLRGFSDFPLTEEMENMHRHVSPFPLTEDMDRRRLQGLSDYPLTEEMDRRGGSDYPLTEAMENMHRHVSPFPLTEDMDRRRLQGLSDYPLTEEMDRRGGSDYPLTEAMDRRRLEGRSDFPITDRMEQQRREGVEEYWALREENDDDDDDAEEEDDDADDDEEEDDEDDGDVSEDNADGDEEVTRARGVKVGARVLITGLTSRPELNDTHGIVLSFDSDKGRFVVMPLSGASKDTMLIKLSNLTATEDAAGAAQQAAGPAAAKESKEEGSLSKKRFSKGMMKLMKLVIEGVPGALHPVRTLRNRELQNHKGDQKAAAKKVASRLDGTLVDDVAGVVTGMLPIVGLPVAFGHTLWLRLRRVAIICELAGHNARARAADIFAFTFTGKGASGDAASAAPPGLENAVSTVWLTLAVDAITPIVPVGAITRKLTGADSKIAKGALEYFGRNSRRIPTHQWEIPITPFAGDKATAAVKDATAKAVKGAEKNFPKSVARAQETAAKGKTRAAAAAVEGRKQAKMVGAFARERYEQYVDLS